MADAVTTKVPAPKYRGKLAKSGSPPIPRGTILGGTPSLSKVAAAYGERLDYNLEGLALLCTHYEIQQEDPTVRYMLLALRLANDWVPYFKPTQRKRGPKVDRVNGLRLALDVADARRAGASTDEAALVKIALKGLHKDEKGTLRKKLQRARKDPVVRMCLEMAREFSKHGGSNRRADLIAIARASRQNTKI